MYNAAAQREGKLILLTVGRRSCNRLKLLEGRLRRDCKKALCGKDNEALEWFAWGGWGLLITGGLRELAGQISSRNDMELKKKGTLLHSHPARHDDSTYLSWSEVLYLKMENGNLDAYERNWPKTEKQITHSWNASKLGSLRELVCGLGCRGTKGAARRDKTLMGS